MITAPEPRLAPRSTLVSSSSQSEGVWSNPLPLVARGSLSLMKHSVPDEDLVADQAPSQMKAWL